MFGLALDWWEGRGYMAEARCVLMWTSSVCWIHEVHYVPRVGSKKSQDALVAFIFFFPTLHPLGMS